MLDSLMNNYLLLSKIGEGSFSEVLKVKDKQTGSLHAAKRITKPFTSMEEVSNYEELQTFKKLSYHENIIYLHQFVYEPDTGILTLIFNLMDCSMYDFIKDRKRKLAETKVKSYIFQLIQAIAFLHKSGIFHRYNFTY